MRFEELNLSTPLLEAVAQLDFTEMTEIQEKAIPLLLEAVSAVTEERVRQAAASVRPDTIYFLKGKEA